MRSAEQRRCTHGSLSCTITAWPHENKPRQSKQLVRAANVSVVLNSAIASDVTPANPAAAVHPSCAPLSSAAAPTHHHRVQTPQRRTKTRRGRANSSCTRQMPRSCLIRQLPAPSHLRIQRQLCTHIMRPAEQRRCTHASSSCTNTAAPHENKPRQSK